MLRRSPTCIAGIYGRTDKALETHWSEAASAAAADAGTVFAEEKIEKPLASMHMQIAALACCRD